MPDCSFCGAVEQKKFPLCHACGALRYPVEGNNAGIPRTRQQKLKLSATVAAAIVTPGAFVFLALAGANHINAKIKKRN